MCLLDCIITPITLFFILYQRPCGIMTTAHMNISLYECDEHTFEAAFMFILLNGPLKNKEKKKQ